MLQKSWQNQKLIWIKGKELVINFFDCIFIFTDDNLFDVNVRNNIMIFLFLPRATPRARGAWNLIGVLVRNGLRLFLLFGEKYCFIRKLHFFSSNLFGNVFLTSVVTVAVCKTYMLNIFFHLEKIFSSLTFHWIPCFHKFHFISVF